MNTTIQHLLFFFLMMPLNLVNQNLGRLLAFFKSWLALSWYSAKISSSSRSTDWTKTRSLHPRVGQATRKLVCSVLKRFVKYLFDLLMLFLLTSFPFWARKTVNHFFDLLFCNLLYYCFYLIVLLRQTEIWIYEYKDLIF